MTETTTVEQAQKVIGDLEDELEGRNGRAAILHKKHESLAFAAATGDKKARADIAALNIEITNNDGEIDVITAALTEANTRLEAAKQAEAQTADREQAEQLRAALAEFVETGHEIDLAFQDLAAHAGNLQQILDRIHQLGCPSPSSEQLRVLGEISARTALMKTPWARAVELVPPPQRRDFKSLIDTWAAQIEQNIRARLGEPKEEQAA